MNIWDIVILLAIAGVVGFGFYRRRKRRAAGKGGCCENCSACAVNCGKK